MKELFVSDMDGTLLGKDQRISSTSLNILNNLIDLGLLFTVATARSLDSAWPLLEDLKLNCPIILHNGVFIYDPVKKEIIQSHTMDDSTAWEVIEVMERGGISPFVFTREEEGNKIYHREVRTFGQRAFLEQKLSEGDKRFTPVERYELQGKEIVMVNVMADLKTVEAMAEQIEALGNGKIRTVLVKEIYRDFWFLEVVCRQATKRHGVEELRSLVEADRVTGFGDNLNDLPLFQASDRRIAMANAMEELKVQAHEVIGHHDDHSVALWLESQNIFD